MINLYRLAKMYAHVERALFESGGEVTPEIEEMFNAIEAERDDKLEALASLLKNADAEVAIYKAEEARLKGIRQGIERRMERLEAMAVHLLPYDEKWSKGPHKLSFRESQAVEITDFERVPREFIRVKTSEEVDKTKAAQMFKAEQGNEAERVVPLIPGLDYVTRYNLQVK